MTVLERIKFIGLNRRLVRIALSSGKPIFLLYTNIFRKKLGSYKRASYIYDVIKVTLNSWKTEQTNTLG